MSDGAIPEAGLREVRRATDGEVVVFTFDKAVLDREWLADIESGRWAERHASLLDLDQLDAGFRLVVAP